MATNRDTDPRYAGFNAKLVTIAEIAPELPAWYDDWLRLGPDSTDEARLRVYQAIRDSGSLPAIAGFALVA